MIFNCVNFFIADIIFMMSIYLSEILEINFHILSFLVEVKEFRLHDAELINRCRFFLKK